MKSWQFVESPGGDWYWVSTDVNSHKTRMSTATFKTRSECVADAMSCGYSDGLSSGRPAKTKRMERRGSRQKGSR